MIDTLLSTIAPHLCCGCGKIGSVLCQYCKYNIIAEGFDECLLCSNKNNTRQLCINCNNIAQRGWCVGDRTDILRKLIDDYKFENMRAAHKVLAELLDERIEILPSTTVVVSVPTIAGHIRQRGYDHAALLAKTFAKYRQLTYRPLIRRVTTTSQRNATKTQRFQQANVAFKVTKSLNPHTPYLLVDDIVTTGATLTAAVHALRTAGAQEVWVTAVARQPLD